MAILIALLCVIIIGILIINLAIRAAQTIGLMLVAILAVALAGTACIGLAVAAASLALFYQIGGSSNLGYEIACAILIGLTVAWLLGIAVFREITGFPARIRNFFAPGSQEPRQGSEPLTADTNLTHKTPITHLP